MPKIIKPTSISNGKAIISLCDYSGNWPRPFTNHGYTVIHYDLKHGDDVLTIPLTQYIVDAQGLTIAGVLMAPPCTDFSVSGAQYWPAKDADGTTDHALAIVDACTFVGRHFERVNGAWWCLENPVGRLPKLRPGLGKPLLYVQPYEYAHFVGEAGEELFERNRYTKKTGLWGSFNAPLLASYAMENGGPIRVCAQGSWLQKLGGKSERTKELRSMTPEGLAEAFAWVQHLTETNQQTKEAA